MAYIIAGLGNPGEEYTNTRHNTGRIMIEHLAKKFDFSEFKDHPKTKSRIAEGTIGAGKKKQDVKLVEPNNFMNRSGASIAPFISSVKKAQQLIVIYDDLDLGIGSIKVSYNKSAGGHRGLDSVIKALKTMEFIRIRVGISPVTAAGKVKKPIGGEVVEKHILGQFKKPEQDTLKKVAKTVAEAIEMIILEGKDKAMGEFNTR
jgi:PTH1 family peptidyl-tRNA hydrolase